MGVDGGWEGVGVELRRGLEYFLKIDNRGWGRGIVRDSRVGKNTRKIVETWSILRQRLFYSILFYSILFYSILFYSILFYSILFYSILFYSKFYSNYLDPHPLSHTFTNHIQRPSIRRHEHSAAIPNSERGNNNSGGKSKGLRSWEGGWKNTFFSIFLATTFIILA